MSCFKGWGQGGQEGQNLFPVFLGVFFLVRIFLFLLPALFRILICRCSVGLASAQSG